MTNTTQEFKNICAKCGAENTLWPIWRGRKRFYKCENDGKNGTPAEYEYYGRGCGELSHGITPTEAKRRGLIGGEE